VFKSDGPKKLPVRQGDLKLRIARKSFERAFVMTFGRITVFLEVSVLGVVGSTHSDRQRNIFFGPF
jgi:hypothetical protein